MKRDLSRLLQPRSVAVAGGGAWCRAVIQQLKKIGFDGTIHALHPRETRIEGVPAVPTPGDLPVVPDAVFLGVNRHATIELVGALARMGAGGAVCFASGFAEAAAEDDQAGSLQTELLAAAGDMPVLGPNCYGFVNALDWACLWPDQHGLTPVDRGVAILTQSSNMAINLSMQNRALPVAYLIACGNQAQMTQAAIANALLDDPRVTAIGLHIEGMGDLSEWQEFARRAARRNIPVIAIKVGTSEQAQQATISHTASLAGSAAGADALLRRFGFGQAHTLPIFLETLKLLHMFGPLPHGRISSISCSGGEASLIADTATGTGVTFPPLNTRQHDALRQALGPMVALANPLDYHTYIWRDTAAMTRAWSAMIDPDIALTLTIVDYPDARRADPADWACATDAAIAAHQQTGGRVALVATLPELLPEPIAAKLMAGGVLPLLGLDEAIAAIDIAAHLGASDDLALDLFLPAACDADITLAEDEAKQALAAHGLAVPRSRSLTAGQEPPADLTYPVVVKGMGFAHKTEAGAVALNLQTPGEAAAAMAAIPADQFLIEEMITTPVTELLIGVVRDPAHGYLLTLAAGGVLTEILRDRVTLCLPASDDELRAALGRLRIAPILAGYRGRPGADHAAILAAIRALQDYVVAAGGKIAEVEINPLICTAGSAIAADALIRRLV